MAKSKKLVMLTLATIACGCFVAAVGCSEHTCPHVCTYATDMSKDATHHWYACTDTTCTKTVGKVEHDWDEGAITTAPTTAAEGVKTFTCVVCGQTKTESITAYGTPSAGTGVSDDEYVIANNTTYEVENEMVDEWGWGASTNFIQYKYTVATTGALKVSASATAKMTIVNGDKEINNVKGEYIIPVEAEDVVIVKVGGLFADDAEEGDTLKSTLKVEETTEAPVADGTVFNPYSLAYDEDMGTYTLNTNIKNDSYLYYTVTGDETVQFSISDGNGVVDIAATNLTTYENAYASAGDTLYLNVAKDDVIEIQAILINSNIVEATISLSAEERDTVYEDGTKAHPYAIDEGDDFRDTYFAVDDSVYFTFTAPANGTASIANHEQHKLTISYGPMWETQFVCQDFIPRTTDALEMEVEAGVMYTIVIINQNDAWTVSPVFTFEAAQGGGDSQEPAAIALNEIVSVNIGEAFVVDLTTAADGAYAISVLGAAGISAAQVYNPLQGTYVDYSGSEFYAGQKYQITLGSMMLLQANVIVGLTLTTDGTANEVTVGNAYIVDLSMATSNYTVTTGGQIAAGYQVVNATTGALVDWDYATKEALWGGNVYVITINGLPGNTGTLTITEVTE